MYAGHVVCWPLVSHSEYSPRALLRLEKEGIDGRTDARPVHYTLRNDAVHDATTNASRDELERSK